MKNVVLVNYIELISKSLIDFLNLNTVPLNHKEKYTISLNQKNQKQLTFFLESQLKNSMFFGKETVIINTCEIQENWRCNVIEDSMVNIPKYKIIDDSVWLDVKALNKFYDNLFNQLKNKYKRSIFIQMENIDSLDLIVLSKKLINVDFFKENVYTIIEDGNKIYNRNSFWPNYIIESLEAELVNNNLLI